MRTLFRTFAVKTSEAVGSAWAFIAAVMLIIGWAISGPFFHFSDTWELIINTSTTIITFLMVFLIQNAQNRDSKALHLKLDELIRAVDGARTGLANVVTGVLFLAAMFFTPLYEIVPIEAAAPVLVIVGALMMMQVGQIDWADFNVAFPAFLTIVTMPLTYSIANGIGVGFIAFTLMALFAGKVKDIHWIMWLVSALFVVYFAQGPIMAALN